MAIDLILVKLQVLLEMQSLSLVCCTSSAAASSSCAHAEVLGARARDARNVGANASLSQPNQHSSASPRRLHDVGTLRGVELGWLGTRAYAISRCAEEATTSSALTWGWREGVVHAQPKFGAQEGVHASAAG